MLLHPVVNITIESIYYIAVNTILFSAGGVVVWCDIFVAYSHKTLKTYNFRKITIISTN
jgi:hypothetical protein